MGSLISIGSSYGIQSAPARGRSNMTFRLALTLATTSLFAQSCNAQAPGPEVGATIEATALALGTIRGIGRRMDSINTLQFSGSGTANVPMADGEWMSYEISEATVGLSYSIPARRLDMTRTGSDGVEERVVHVVRGDRAWDERLPGGDPADAAAGAVSERLAHIILTPHGFITAVVQNPDAVSTGIDGGQTTLTVEIDGTAVTATLDENSRPATVEMTVDHPTLGQTQLEAEYTEYVDWPILDVYFPSHIVHRLGGETTLDMTVTDFYQNPYVVFPTPEQLSGSSQ